MKKISYILIAAVFVLHGVALCFPRRVSAETISTPIIITEMLPGTEASGSQEFIELYNQSDGAIDLAAGNWTIQIATSKATTWDKPKSVKLHGSLQSGAYLIISSNYVAPGETKSYLQEYATEQFSSGLTTSSGHVRLVRTNNTLQQEMVDRLEWTTQENGQPVSGSIDGARPKVLEQSLSAGTSLKRVITDGMFSDTGDNAADFVPSLCPSPTAVNTIPAEYHAAPVPTTIDTVNQQCTISDDRDPEEPIPQPIDEPPATLLPTENVGLSTAVSTPKVPSSNSGLMAPQLTELLPNPGSPQTDAEDEFIELYNTNALPYDLSGYVLRVGITGSKKYTFPTGTTVPPKTFVAFFSGDTHLSLSNTSGKVSLFDPLDREISQTEAYGTAKDNQSWARAQGKWQWTTQPTPNAANAIRTPATTAKKASSSKSTAAKSTAAASPKKAKTVATQNAAAMEEPEQKTPVHPLALAVVGGFALLYGAYEYRHDMANKFYQFRSYRAARRENRAQLEGR